MWIKKAHIFKTSGNFPWSQTHTQVPCALLRNESIRIYYATRDAGNRSLTSFVDVSRQEPFKILYIHDQPVMNFGEPGTHDEDGVMVGCIVEDQEALLMYYTGWSRGITVPYRVSIGLAKSTDGGVSFERVYNGPVVDRTPLEPYMTMSPYVVRHEGVWKMWYGSGTAWTEVDGIMEPLYVIKYAESVNGTDWIQNDVLCIEPLHDLEANTRPSVIIGETGFEMWFSYRHSVDYRDGTGAYRIGHANSGDGKKWHRQVDPPGLAPEGDGWMGRMMTYPNVLDVDGVRIMFFNGNSFGKSGFGYAAWNTNF